VNATTSLAAYGSCRSFDILVAILATVRRLLFLHSLDVLYDLLNFRPVLLRTRNFEDLSSGHPFWGVPSALACPSVDKVTIDATWTSFDNSPVSW
jgi:hypothetical protein